MIRVPEGYTLEMRNETRPTVTAWRISCSTTFHAHCWCSTTDEMLAIEIMKFANTLAIPIKIMEVVEYEDAHYEYLDDALKGLMNK